MQQFYKTVQVMLRALLLFFFVFDFSLANAQTLSTSPTLTFSNSNGFNTSIKDGDGGSIDISDIALDIYCINSSGDKLIDKILEYNLWPTYDGVITYGNGDDPHFGWMIRSADRRMFSLRALSFLDIGSWAGLDFTIEAFEDETSKGKFDFKGNTNGSYIQLSQTSGNVLLKLPDIFERVNKVIIYQKNVSNTYIGLNNIKVSMPSAAQVGPIVSSVAVPANDTYTVGGQLDFKVNFSNNITVNTGGGTPRIPLTIGSQTRYASYVSGTGSTGLLFRYIIQSTDQDIDGIQVGTAIQLNSGTIKAADNADAILTLNNVGVLTGVKVAMRPVATATPGSLTICSGDATNIALTSNPVGATFAWTAATASGTVNGTSASSGTSIAQTLTGNGTTNYTVTPTLNGVTGNPITVAVTVNPLAQVTATPSSATIVSGNSTMIALTSIPTGATFSWTVSTVSGSVLGATAGGGTMIAQQLTGNGIIRYNVMPILNGCPGQSKTIDVTVQPAPAVSSITRASGAPELVPSGVSSVDFTVVFNQSVTGVDVGDFSLLPTGNVGGSISTLTGSGTTYTVRVNGVSGDGTFRLALNASGTEIRNGSAIEVIGGYTSGQSYTIDKVNPTLTLVTMSSNNNNPKFARSGNTVITSFTASEAITGVIVRVGGILTAGQFSNNYSTWTANTLVNAGSSEGPLTLSIDFQDLAGNAGGTVTSTTDALPVVVDNTPPVTMAGPIVTAGNEQNVLTWTSSPTASFYKLYGGTTFPISTGLFQTVSAPALSYTQTGLTNGSTYYYSISAVDEAGNESMKSLTISGTPNNIQTITFTAPGPQVYGSSFDLTASSSSLLPVTFASDNHAVATVSGKTVTIIGVGNVNITASQPGNGTTIGAATPVSWPLQITPLPVTVTAAASSKVFGSPEPLGFGFSISPALIGNDTKTGAIARQAGENVGNYEMGIGTFALDPLKYTINYVPANFSISRKTVTINPVANTKVYNQNDPSLSFMIDVPGVPVTGALRRIAGEDVGSYAYSLSGMTVGSNYQLALNATPKFIITPLTINVTATAGNKQYGDTEPVLSYTHLPALKSGDSFNGALARISGETPGNYPVSRGTLALSANYLLNYITSAVDFTVLKKDINIVPTAGQGKVYGDLDGNIDYVANPVLINGDTFTGTLSRTAGTSVNNYPIGMGSLVASNPQNYNITLGTENYAITKKTIVVTATPLSKVYGDADPVILPYTQSTPLVVGDTFTGALSRATGENVGDYVIGKGDLALNANYTLDYTPANLSIGLKAINVVAKAKTKVYGDPDQELDYDFIPALKSGDTFTGALSRAAGENVGDYVIGKGDLALNANYTLNYTPVNLTINAALLRIKAVDEEKFSGTANPVFTAEYIGFVNGENVSVLTSPVGFSTTADINSPIGDYDIIPSGAVANNYQISYTKGVLKIKPGAPTSITLAAVTVYENKAAGTIAGTISSTSDDLSATFTYTLVPGAGDTDNALFSIVGDKINTAAILNFENKAVYKVRVRSTTQYNLWLEREMSISISDVNEVPTLATISDQTICFTTANQSIALTGISAGPETVQTTTLSVSSNNANLFDDLEVKGSGAKGTLNYKVKAGVIAGTATVTVTVKDDGGTANGGVDSYSQTFVITVNALPIVSINSNKGLEISKGEKVLLSATGGSTYEWTDANGIVNGKNTAVLEVRPSQTTTYAVTVTNASGCKESKSFTLTVLDDYAKIKATNILTPNNDGYNDKWVIDNIDFYPNNEVKIFDKAGRLIFGKKGYDNSWDGTFNGTALVEGTYYYVIDFGTNRPRFRGFITIVRPE